jgi:hypothetical protein
LLRIDEHPLWSIGDTHGPIFLPDDEEAGTPMDYPF